MNKILRVLMVLVTAFVFAACSPKVGSEEWCKDMKAKPKGDWTANEFAAYTEHCLLK